MIKVPPKMWTQALGFMNDSLGPEIMRRLQLGIEAQPDSEKFEKCFEFLKNRYSVGEEVAYRRTWIDIDLTGWEYLEGLDIEAEEAKSYCRKDRIPLSLYFRKNSKEGYTGIFKAETWGVNVTAFDRSEPTMGLSFQTLVNRYFQWTAFCLHHEMQHLTQRIFKDVFQEKLGYDPEGCMPPLSVRDEKYDPSGRLRNSKNNGRIDHALRDVEFYPIMASCIYRLEHLFFISACKTYEDFVKVFKNFMGITEDGFFECYYAKKIKSKDEARWKELCRRLFKYFNIWWGRKKAEDLKTSDSDRKWPKIYPLKDRLEFGYVDLQIDI